MAESTTWDRVLAWRLRRQFVDPVGDGDPVEITHRLCGVQAQVPSAAELAIAVRSRDPDAARNRLREALERGELIRTWSVRGTLHLLTPDTAANQLSVLAANRSWEKGSWQRTFATAAVMERLREQVTDALTDGPLTRGELVTAVGAHPEAAEIAEQLRSGWSALLKPLAWQGVLCQGLPRGANVTFVAPGQLSPGWPPTPDPDEAGPALIRDYLGAYGPATLDAFAEWLLRGSTPRRTLAGWRASLGDELVEVDVDGRAGLMLATDVADLQTGRASEHRVTLLPAFDQYVLGPGTRDTAILPAERRALISRAGGWISPVALLDGRIAGTWELVDGRPAVTPFPDVELPAGETAEAVDRLVAAGVS